MMALWPKTGDPMERKRSMGVKRRGGAPELVPRDVIPPGRIYTDTYGAVWKKAAKLKPGGSGLRVSMVDFKDASVNALRCALTRAKRKGRVPADVHVRDDGDQVYLYR